MSLFTTALRVHQAVYEWSGGLVGHRLLGIPTLLLHTIGRRSGKPRTSALAYARDGDRHVVVASNGGSDRPPGWWFNLEARPDVEIQVGRTRVPATAHSVVAGDDDFDRLWDLVNDMNQDRYRAYQGKTDRPIPVVVLTPR